ncbi:uncharacterized protein PAC_05456 [Phialocephala subalpina]|uniref:Uncharacterized protein n=1 Tax=Phialocephala subalpina TaxID=576137 RepID=A0A1L7WS12_9HELO|nr:uncharacterized protein PAC_05456 [Phialocephala subalpina]
MFCSLVQIQVLVLVFCSVVVAIPRVIPGDGRTNPAQEPIPIIRVQPASSIGLEQPQSSKDVSTLGRNATIKLFPPSPVAFRHAFAFGCKEPQFNTITLATDVCLSGHYYLNHNMLISESPVCHDGSTPTLAYYPSRGCMGNTQFESTAKPIPEYCLWGGTAPLHWSMIFRCGPHATSAQGADKHEVAVPPTSLKSLPYPGIYKPYEGPHALLLSRSECTDRAVGWNGARQYTAPVGTCLPMADSINIKQPATCPNGTRALWARFENPNCNDGQISAKYGLVDIHDTDLDVEKCLLADAFGSGDQIRSIAFWCDGDIRIAPPRSKLMYGKFIESIGVGGKDPVSKSLKPDTCVMMSGIRKVYSVNITRLAVCENGTTAVMVFYQDQFCRRNDAKLRTLDASDLNQWLGLNGAGSWALQCDGVKVAPAGEVSTYSPPTYSPAPQLGEFKLCQGWKKTWNTFVRDPGTCLTSFTYPGDTHAADIIVTRAPSCANGTNATLALFKDGICQTEPNEFRNLDEHVLNQCLSLNDAKSWAFWCDGKDVEKAVHIGGPADYHTPFTPAPVPTTSNPTLEPTQDSTKSAVVIDKHSGRIHRVQIPSHRPGTTAGAFSRNACTADLKPTFIFAEPDRCFSKVSNQQIMFANPAICADGMKASIALFGDKSCGTSPIEVKVFKERDFARCLTLEGIGSLGFLCSGVKALLPRPHILELPASINLTPPKKADTTDPKLALYQSPNSFRSVGRFSEDPCVGMKRTFKQSPRDTCITRTKSLGRSITVAKPAMCANGTRAIIALYKDNACTGQPDEFRNFEATRYSSCLAFAGIESWGFWCDGITPPKQTETSEPAIIRVEPISSRPKTVASKPADNSKIDLISAPYRSPNSHRSPGLWSASSCVKNMPTLVLSSLPDTCNSISHPFQIHSAGICADGSLAVVALYESAYCGGTPDRFAILDFKSKNQCFEFEGMRTWSFWCGGPDLKDIPSLMEVGTHVPEVKHGAPMGLTVAVFSICVLVSLIGVWIWFGTAIANLMEALFPWPVKYSSVKADPAEEKVQEDSKDPEKEAALDV